MMIGKAFIARVRCPVPGPPRPESWLVPLPADPGWGLAVLYWFCGGHGPGETPGPFPNPEAKAWHGDGTALERVWESSAPPHSHVGGSRRASAPGTFFCFSSGFFRPSRTSRQRLSGSSKVFFRGLRPSRSSGPPGRASMTSRRVLLLSGAYRRTRVAGDPFSLMTVRIGWLDAARSWMPRYFRMLSKTSSTLSRYSFLPM